MTTGTLYLIPTSLGDGKTPWLLPQDQALVSSLTHFVVEAEKTARHHLKCLGITTPLRDVHMDVLNEHTPITDIQDFLQPLLNGHDVGLMSEAGCPAVADPGAQLVRLAHAHNITVQPFIGPSSILLALMASGANGQQFTFNGYISADKQQRTQDIKTLQTRVRHDNTTQILIETPYRNEAMLADLIHTLDSDIHLCIAADLTLASETIISMSVEKWRQLQDKPILKKRPCIFLVFA